MHPLVSTVSSRSKPRVQSKDLSLPGCNRRHQDYGFFKFENPELNLYLWMLLSVISIIINDKYYIILYIYYNRTSCPTSRHFSTVPEQIHVQGNSCHALSSHAHVHHLHKV